MYTKYLFILAIFTLLSCGGKRQSNPDAKALANIEDTQISDSTDQLVNELRNPCETRDSVITGRTKYLIICNAFFNGVDILKPNAALLITDKEEIMKNEKLFFNNPEPKTYLCGYHFNIQFWDDSIKPISSILYNMTCGSYCFDYDLIKKQMSKYARMLEDKPSHYIYTLTIDSKFTIEDVKRELNDNHLFFMDGNAVDYIRFSVDLGSSITATKSDEIMKIIPKEILSKPPVSYYYIGEDLVRHNYIHLYLKKDTNLDELRKHLLKNEVSFFESTPLSYNVQILDKSNNLNKIRSRLKKYSFIKDIQYYLSDNKSTNENYLDVVYIKPHRTAQFQGGQEALNKFIKDNYNIPEGKIKITGKIALAFVVDRNGELKNVTIARGIDPKYDREAVRVIKSMPKWIPGRFDGKVVSSYNILPIIID